MVLTGQLLRFFGAVCLGLFLIISPRAQIQTDHQRQLDQQEGRIDSLDHRMESLEQMHIEGALARIENTVQTDHQLLMWVAGAMVLMGLETGARLFRKPRKQWQEEIVERGEEEL